MPEEKRLEINCACLGDITKDILTWALRRSIEKRNELAKELPTFERFKDKPEALKETLEALKELNEDERQMIDRIEKIPEC